MNIKKDKILRLQEKLDKNDILITNNIANIFYLTGINFDGLTIAVSKNSFYILSSPMVACQIKKFFRNKNLIIAEDFQQQLKMLKEKIGTKNVVLEEETTSLKVYNTLKQNFKDVKIKNYITQLRQIKDLSEISKIKTACNIVKKVLKEVKNILKEGITELEVKNFILKKFLDYKVEPSFDPIVAFDENTSYPHHVSTDKKFKKNSLVLIDLGCKYEGYCCDVTRMFNVERNQSAYYFYNQLKRLQKQLIFLCKVNTKVKEIDLYARKFVEQLGLKDKYLHSTGHGIGIEVHEPPRISYLDETILQKNMVVTIEPGIYFEDKFGLRIEDDIWIKDKGSVVLTKKLISVSS